MKKIRLLTFGIVGITGLIFAIVKAMPLDTTVSQESYQWVGKWRYESPNGKIDFSLYLGRNANQELVGWHSMVDGRIHGGAIDAGIINAKGEKVPSLTNCALVDTKTLECDFFSGYTGTTGEAQIEAADNNTILFRIVTMPSKYDSSLFPMSPLANLAYQFNGINGAGQQAIEGVSLTRQSN